LLEVEDIEKIDVIDINPDGVNAERNGEGVPSPSKNILDEINQEDELPGVMQGKKGQLGMQDKRFFQHLFD